jgi:hypothetical protein
MNTLASATNATDRTETPASPRRRTEARALEIVIYAGCAFLLLSQIAFNFVDIDLWHQMGLIRESLAAGRLLTQDPFAYTPTLHPMIDHEWAAGALAFFLTQWMSGAGILLPKFATAFGTLFLALRLARQRGASATVLGFLAPVSIGLFYGGFLPVIRAHAYSFLFSAVLLCVFEMDRQGRHQWLWVWLAAWPLWVNLHAGFVVGIGYVFLYCVEQASLRKPLRSAALAFCGMGIEVFINPYGTRYFTYLARALTMARPRIAEWKPIWTLGWNTTVLFTVALAVLVFALARSQALREPGVLLLAASGMEAVLHRKLLPFFAIAWLCYVPAYFQKTTAGQWLQKFSQRHTRFLLLAWTFVIAACLVPALKLRFWKVEVPQVAGKASYPVGAVDYLAAQNFHGNVMVPFASGAYVSWKLYPAVKVSVDSRYEVAYPDDWVERTFRFYDAAGDWRATLDVYPTDLVLAPSVAPVGALLREHGWKRVYVDAQFEICARPGTHLPAADHSGTIFSGTFP